MSKNKTKYTPVRNCPGVYKRPAARGRRATWGARAYDPSRRQSVWIGSFDTFEDAKKARTSFREGSEGPGGGTATRMTVAKCADRWLTRESARQASTLRTYAYGIKRFVDHFGDKQLRALTYEECDGWARSQPRSAVIAAKIMLADARDRHYIPRSPLEGVKIPRSTGRSEWPVLSDADIEEILEVVATAVGHRNRNEIAGLMAMSAFLGLRMSETFALKRSHFDLEAGRVRVVAQVDRFGDLKEPKGQKSRLVALTPSARKALERFPGSKYPEFLYPRPDGGPYTAGSFHYHFRKVVAASGFTGLQFHEFRHHFLTWLLHQGVPVWTIAAQAGHGRQYGHRPENEGSESPEVLLPVTKRYVRTNELACEKVSEILCQGVREFRPGESRRDFDPHNPEIDSHRFD